MRKVAHWLLIATIAAYLLTGFGITQYRIVEAMTFGLLGKNLAFRIHEQLWIPFVVLLALHIFLSLFGRSKKANAS